VQRAVFPELALLGYPPKDLLERPPIIKENLRRLEKLASEIKASTFWWLRGYKSLEVGKPLVNSVALIGEGRIWHEEQKDYSPPMMVFDEIATSSRQARSAFGTPRAGALGVTICEDIWTWATLKACLRYELDPVRELADQKIDVLIDISAFPYT